MEDAQFSLWENPHAYPRLLVPRHMRLLALNEIPAKNKFKKTTFPVRLAYPRDSHDYRIASRSSSENALAS